MILIPYVKGTYSSNVRIFWIILFFVDRANILLFPPLFCHSFWVPYLEYQICMYFSFHFLLKWKRIIKIMSLEWIIFSVYLHLDKTSLFLYFYTFIIMLKNQWIKENAIKQMKNDKSNRLLYKHSPRISSMYNYLQSQGSSNFQHGHLCEDNSGQKSEKNENLPKLWKPTFQRGKKFSKIIQKI